MQDFDRIETPENVELERRLAGIGTRFIAGLLDHLIIAGIFTVLGLILVAAGVLSSLDVVGIIESGDIAAWLVVLFTLVTFAVSWGYFVLFEMLTNGRSPGKKQMRIRVVKEGGGAISFIDIAVRNLLRVVDMFPIMLYAVGGTCMFFSRRVQRLGDMAAGTVVICEQVRDRSAPENRSLAGEPDREASPETLRATGLSPEEYRLVFNYVNRREQLTIDSRKRVLAGILKPIFERRGKTLADEPIETLEAYVGQLVQKALDAETTADTTSGDARREEIQ